MQNIWASAVSLHCDSILQTQLSIWTEQTTW